MPVIINNYGWMHHVIMDLTRKLAWGLIVWAVLPLVRVVVASCLLNESFSSQHFGSFANFHVPLLGRLSWAWGRNRWKWSEETWDFLVAAGDTFRSTSELHLSPIKRHPSEGSLEGEWQSRWKYHPTLDFMAAPTRSLPMEQGRQWKTLIGPRERPVTKDKMLKLQAQNAE